MENKKLLKTSGLLNPDIRLKDIKNLYTTTVNPVCFDSVILPYCHNYFVFLVNSKGFCKPNYSVFSNPYSAVICARSAKKKYHYLIDFHIEVVRIDPSCYRHISFVSGFGEPVEDDFLPF